jgi:hypothetical protein
MMKSWPLLLCFILALILPPVFSQVAIFGPYSFYVAPNSTLWRSGQSSGSILPPGDLDLKNKSIIELSDGLFLGISSLIILDLSHNKLTTSQAGVFSCCYCYCYCLTSVNNLPLNNNQISMLPPGVFRGLKLRFLILSYYLISTLPPGICNGGLETVYMYLDNNPTCVWLPGL